MALRRHYFTSSHTLGALLLELLNDAWRDLLFRDCVPLAFAFGTSLHIVRFVSTWPPTMGTNHLSIVSDLELFTNIELVKGNSDLQIHWGTQLFLLLSSSTVKLARVKFTYPKISPKMLPKGSIYCFSGSLTHSSPHLSYLRLKSASDNTS